MGDVVPNHYRPQASLKNIATMVPMLRNCNQPRKSPVYQRVFQFNIDFFRTVAQSDLGYMNQFLRYLIGIGVDWEYLVPTYRSIEKME